MKKILILFFITINYLLGDNIFYDKTNLFNPNSFFIYKDSMCVVDLGRGVSCLSEENTKLKKMDIEESFRLPAAAIANNNLIYICDYRNNRMVLFDAEKNNVVKVFSHALMSDPEGVAIDDEENIYVASYGNGKILKFDKNGDFLSVFIDNLVHPHGIFFYNNKLYVTELYLDKRVIVYDMLGKKLSEFGNKGDDRLRYPTSVWVDADGIYVSDATASAIKVYDLVNYNLKNIVGGISGSSSKSYYYPYGVATQGNNMFITDTHNRAIKVINKKTLVSKSIIMDEQLKNNFIQKKNELTSYKIKYDTTTSSNPKKQLISISKDRASFEICLDDKNCKIYSGYDYIWNVKLLEDKYIAVIDEPGALQIIDIKDFSTINYSLTSFQFDPLEPKSGFIYRFQDIEYYDGYFYLANTLPGNIIKINPLSGSVEQIFDISNTIFKPLKIKKYNENLVINDIYGFIYIFNLKTNQISKINNKFDDLIDIQVVNEFLFVTDINGIYTFNKDFNFMGFIPLKEKVLSIDTKKNKVIISTNDKILTIDKLNIKKSDLVVNVTKINSTIYKNNITDSSFIRAYGNDITKKPLNYYKYYITKDGIVKYDFGFSWLNFNIPVDAGYGAHVYFPVVSHYSMLSYYDFKLNGNINSKNEFEKHVKFLINNISIKENKAYLYEEVKLKNTKKPFLSASTQISAAAVIYKYYKETKDEKYLDLAKKLLNVLDELKYEYKNYSLYSNFPQEDRPVPYIQDLLWNIVFLDELESIGSNQKNILLNTLSDFKKDKKINFFNKSVMPLSFEDNSISIYNTKIYNRAIENILMKYLINTTHLRINEYGFGKLWHEYSSLKEIEETKIGNCTHFTAIISIWLDSLGIPYRILDIKGSVANHAMVEYKDSTGNWKLLDPYSGVFYNVGILELLNEQNIKKHTLFSVEKTNPILPDGYDIYTKAAFFNNITFIEAYEDIAYLGKTKPYIKDWRYILYEKK